MEGSPDHRLLGRSKGDITLRNVTVFLASLTAAVCQAEVRLDRNEFFRHASSVLKIEARNTNGSYALGTAVTIAPGRVVTNCHVIRRAITITVVKGALRWPAVAQSVDHEHDLCYLVVPKLESPPVTMGSTLDLKVGQTVAAMGYIGGMGITFREGHIRELYRHEGGRVIQSTTAFNSGASGGALFDAEAKLIGILTFRLPGPHGYYFSTPADWISERMSRVENFTSIAPLGESLTFWERSPADLPFFMRLAMLEAGAHWDKVLDLAEQWSNEDTQNPEPQVARGKAYMRLGRSDRALAAFQKAIDLEPGSEAAWFNLGSIYFHQGNLAAVSDVYNRLKDMGSDLAEDLAATAGLTRH